MENSVKAEGKITTSEVFYAKEGLSLGGESFKGKLTGENFRFLLELRENS